MRRIWKRRLVLVRYGVSLCLFAIFGIGCNRQTPIEQDEARCAISESREVDTSSISRTIRRRKQFAGR